MRLLRPTDPARRALSAWGRRALRKARDRAREASFSTRRDAEPLPFLIAKEESPLHRRLHGIDSQLFENKKTNLRLAIERLDGILIRPGETFSFWRLVGPPTRSRGYLDGLTISGGEPGRGAGGGLCQLSNALFWLALHCELAVVERHRHSFDLFPDEERRIPFGTGATVVYNYKDLRLSNPTDFVFQFRMRLGASVLGVQLFCSSAPTHRFELEERNPRFERIGGDYFRSNEILRKKWTSTNERAGEEVILRNYCRCRYQPSEALQ